MLAWSMGCRPSLSDERPFRALFPLGVLILVYDERMLAKTVAHAVIHDAH